MTLVRRNSDVGFTTDDEQAPVLEQDKARQGDSDLENFRVLDLSLFLGALALGFIGVVIAILLR
jgi:hypothetical protein